MTARTPSVFRIGLIGTGGISAAHLNCLRARSDVTVTALCDINSERLQQRCKEYGGEGFTDYRVMLERTELDAVWLCTPPDVRREPLMLCAQKHIAVLCEKPVERVEQRARRIADELKTLHARVQVGYVFRSMPVIQRLREEMQGDTVHALQSLYCCDMSLTRKFPEWFYHKEKSGGALVDQATHNLDLLRYLFGEVKEVHGVASNPVHAKKGHYTVDETLALSLAFVNGMVATHTHTWVGDAWRNEMILSGEKRLYRLDLFAGALRIDEGGKSREFRQEQRSIYEFENERFLAQIASDDWSGNPCDYEDSTKTLHLTLACDKAVESGTKAII